MTVISVPELFSVPSASPPFRKWLGNVKFTAHAEDFASTPTYIWTDPPNSRIQNTGSTPEIRDFTAAPPTYSTPYYGIDLGSQIDASDLVTSSTVSVKVADSNGFLTDSYNVHWHLQYENRQPLPDGPHMKQLVQFVANPGQSDGRIPFGDSIQAVLVPAADFDGAAMIDGVLVVTKALGLHTDQAEAIWSIFKTIIGMDDWEGHAEQITVTSSSVNNNPYKFNDTKLHHPENFNGAGPDGTFFKGYCYRVRYHHTVNSFADEYDHQGFNSPHHLFTVDKTEPDGMGFDNGIGFEMFYVSDTLGAGPPPEGDYDLAQVRASGGIK